MTRIRRIVLVGHDNEGTRRMFQTIVDALPDVQFLMVITLGLYYRKSFLSSVLKLLREASWYFIAIRFLELVLYRLKGDTVVRQCRRRGIPIVYTRDINSPACITRLQQYGPDVLVSLYTMQIYERPTLVVARYGSFQVHPSLLPKYRGLEVFFWVLANGEKETGVSVFFLHEKIDSGPVVRQETVKITPGTTVAGLYRTTADLGGELLVKALRDIDADTVQVLRSNECGSYYAMPDPSSYRRFRALGRKFFEPRVVAGGMRAGVHQYHLSSGLLPQLQAMASIGTVFNASTFFSYSESECQRVITSYFDPDELREKRVLDAGCRTGDYTRVFWRLGAVPYGVDLSPVCIEKARRENTAIQDRFCCADICDLSVFPDDFFDLVFCVGVMPYLNEAQVEAAISEFRRVTRTGGRILLVFQKCKGPLVEAATWILNLIPFKAYLTIVPVLAVLVAPFSGLIVGRRVSYSFVKYGVFLSLRGIHFGSPEHLEPYAVATPDGAGISLRLSRSFLLIKTGSGHRQLEPFLRELAGGSEYRRGVAVTPSCAPEPESGPRPVERRRGGRA